MVKTLSYDENGMKKGAWSRDEDDKLRVYIQRYGHWNWRELPKFAGLKRCGKSCRLRWLNYLRPNVKRGNYTREEDELILKLIEEHGNKWSLISAKLSGRTDNEVKNHWHTKLKKLSKQSSTTKTTSEEKNQTSQSSESETSYQNIKEIESPPPAPETLLADINDASSSPTILETSEPFMLSNEEVISFSSIYDCAFESSICGINDVPAAAEYNCVASSSSSSSLSSSPSSERLSEYHSDFWTQPFLADTYYYENVCQSNSLVEERGFMFPYSNSYGDDDDVVDLFYQVMQQYPEEY